MLHKICRAMKECDSAYELRGVIEMDHSFFGRGVEGDKRGRGTRKTSVIIEASTHGAAAGFARMHVLRACGGGRSPLAALSESIFP